MGGKHEVGNPTEGTEAGDPVSTRSIKRRRSASRTTPVELHVFRMLSDAARRAASPCRARHPRALMPDQFEIPAPSKTRVGDALRITRSAAHHRVRGTGEAWTATVPVQRSDQDRMEAEPNACSTEGERGPLLPATRGDASTAHAAARRPARRLPRMPHNQEEDEQRQANKRDTE